MHVTYALSNRQRKELLERARPISIAIPAPDAEDYDVTDFVVRALPEIERAWIVQAEEVPIPVNPLIRPDGLAAKLGSIVRNEDRDTTWHILVVCVVVELQAERVSRQKRGLTQWPGSVSAS